MTDRFGFGSGHDAEEQESEVDVISGSGFNATDAGGGPAEPEVVYAEIVDDDDDDEATGVISGDASGLSEVTDLRAQRDEYLDSLRRLQADFENYKKRVAKQQSDQVARAALSLVEKLLPVLDTLDLATSHIGDAGSADGRALVAASNQLRDVLAKEGLERIDPIGEEFDPNAHEAVGHVPAEAEGAAGARSVPSHAGAGQFGQAGAPAGAVPAGASGEPVVAEVMRPGYRWRGAVVRPAMVTVRG
jgi:molecular chaperone GrpE